MFFKNYSRFFILMIEIILISFLAKEIIVLIPSPRLRGEGWGEGF